MSLSRYILSRVAGLLPATSQARLKRALTIPDQLVSLQIMRRAGFTPGAILDIGAYVGKFAKICQVVWPESPVLMFEPQPDKQPGLQALTRAHPKVSLRQELLSMRAGNEVDFHLHASGSSMKTFRSDPGAPIIKLRTTTLDEAVKGTPFERPELIKIDVQGAEMDVIQGGMQTFGRASVVILELTVVPEYEGAPLFHEMVAFMASQGFRVYDISTIWRNSRSSAMHEADVIFARPDSRVWDEKNYWTK